MRQLLFATALIVPAGALAQQDGSATAEEIGEAAGDAVQTTIEGLEEGTRAAGEAIGDALQGAETELERREPAEGEVAEPTVRDQAAHELRIDWLTGATVTSPEGERIGTVNDVIADLETGELTAAIVSVGGFLGAGAKQIAVPWDELQIDPDATEVAVDLTREEAQAAPEYAFREGQDPPSPAAGAEGATGD